LDYAKPTGAHAAALEKSAARRLARLEEKALTEHTVPMVGTPQERAERDKQRQLAIYFKGLTLHKKQLMEGPHGEQFKLLIKYLNQMTIADAATLVDAVKDSAWLSTTDQPTKNDALRIIDSTIVGLRINNGMCPFDDPMIGQEPNAFLLIRKILTGVGHL
jgi:hypothetical protein